MKTYHVLVPVQGFALIEVDAHSADDAEVLAEYSIYERDENPITSIEYVGIFRSGGRAVEVPELREEEATS